MRRVERVASLLRTRVGFSIVFFVSINAIQDACFAENPASHRAAIPNCELLGSSVKGRVHIFSPAPTDQQKPEGPRVYPIELLFDIQEETSAVTGMSAYYDTSLKFEDLVRSVDEYHKQWRHEKRLFENTGIALWRNEKDRYAIQASESDNYKGDGCKLVFIWIDSIRPIEEVEESIKEH